MEPIKKIDIFTDLADSPEIVLDKLNEIIDLINLLQEKIGANSVGMKAHDLEEAIRKERARQDAQNSAYRGSLNVAQAGQNPQQNQYPPSQSWRPLYGSSGTGESFGGGILSI